MVACSVAVATTATTASTTACSGLIWLGAMILRFALALAGRRLTVDLLSCLSLLMLHWLSFLWTLYSLKSCQWGKIACTVSITGSMIVGISSFVKFSFLLRLSSSLFCYAWLGRTPLFQLWTESVILVACSYFASCGRYLHMHYSNRCLLLHGA